MNCTEFSLKQVSKTKEGAVEDEKDVNKSNPKVQRCLIIPKQTVRSPTDGRNSSHTLSHLWS